MSFLCMLFDRDATLQVDDDDDDDDDDVEPCWSHVIGVRNRGPDQT